MAIVEEKHTFELKSYVYCCDRLDEFVHWHERMEIVQILENKSRFIVDGKNIVAEKGDLIVLKEGAIHLHIIEYGFCAYRIIHFPYRLFIDTKRHPGNTKVHIKGEEIREIPDLEENLNALFEIMDKQSMASTAEENPFFSYLVMAAYSELAKHFPEEEKSVAAKSEKKELYRVVEYINTHFKEDINIQKVSDALFISRSRLAGLFKKYMDMSMNEYVTIMRLDRANQLIADGENVTDAAIESGFQSIRTFNNAYRAHMGMTPSEYIKKFVKTKKD